MITLHICYYRIISKLFYIGITKQNSILPSVINFLMSIVQHWNWNIVAYIDSIKLLLKAISVEYKMTALSSSINKNKETIQSSDIY